jgi:hypothetical protein
MPLADPIPDRDVRHDWPRSGFAVRISRLLEVGSCVWPADQPVDADGLVAGLPQSRRTGESAGGQVGAMPDLAGRIPPARHCRFNSRMPGIEQINPRIVVWARETAGLSLEEAADKLGLETSSRSTGTEKLEALEAGQKASTPSSCCPPRRSIAARWSPSFSTRPPERGERGEDFRTIAGSVSPRDNGILDALLRDLRARQHLLRAMLDDEEEDHLLPFVDAAQSNAAPRVSPPRSAQSLV